MPQNTLLGSNMLVDWGLKSSYISIHIMSCYSIGNYLTVSLVFLDKIHALKTLEEQSL